MKINRALGIILASLGFISLAYLILTSYKILSAITVIEDLQVYLLIFGLLALWAGLYISVWRYKGNKYLKQFFVALPVIAIATLIDFLTHSSSPSFYVSFEYYVGKVFASTLWGMLTLIIFDRVKNIKMKAFLFSLVIAATLQVKYFFQGYDRFFVFLFLFLHFFMFLIPAEIIFPKYEKVFRAK